MQLLHVILIKLFIASFIVAFINLFSCNVKTKAIIIDKRYDFDVCYVKVIYMQTQIKELSIDNCVTNNITIYYNYFLPNICSEQRGGSLILGSIFFAMCIIYITILIILINKKKKQKNIEINQFTVSSYNVMLGTSDHGKINVIVVNP